MTDSLRALIEAELILLRLAAAAPPPPMRVRVIKPGDPDYGNPPEFDEDGQPIMRVTIHFDRLDATDFDD